MSMRQIGQRIAANETPLMMNSQPGSTHRSSNAARAGPKMREPVMTAVFNETTLEMCRGSTSSITKPRRAGLSTACTMPIGQRHEVDDRERPMPASASTPEHKASAA